VKSGKGSQRGRKDPEERLIKKAAKAIEKNRKRDASIDVVDTKGRPVVGASVRVEQLNHDFLFGCNIYMFDQFKTPRENQLYKRRFKSLFNYATVGFYWRWYEPEQGKPNYAYTDKVVSWCMKNGIRMKGHPLLWDHEAGRPTWAAGQPAEDVQRKRVTGVVKRFAGKIRSWEVVNEPSHCRAVQIDEPYRWARDADPKAYLIVNDFEVMANGFPPFLQMLQEAMRTGVPFDGIGIQAHEPRTMRFPLEQVQSVLDHYAALGKDLHITEFTPASSGEPIAGSHLKANWDETAQADYAVKFYTVCFAHPAVVAVTWWDLCDRGSWLKGGGMLREDLGPKPVYEALSDLIHNKWKTRAKGKTDRSGRFSFRGFLGTYRVTARARGTKVESKLHIGRGKGKLEEEVRLGCCPRKTANDPSEPSFATSSP